jgi:competence protein ComEC
MPWGALAFALGVWAVQRLAVLPAPTFVAMLAALGAALLALGRCRRRLALAGALLCGCAWAAGFAHWRLADELPAAWEGRDVEVTGVVAGLPQAFERGVRFTFAVEQAAGPVPKRISLSWYRDEAAEMPAPRAGERWRFVVRLKRPHGNLNPHGFDWEGWLFERGIRATGYVRKSPPAERRDAAPVGVDRLRAATRERILRSLPDAPYAGVVVALVVGDQQAISPELWRLFAATGITHLMSISGLHVTMVGALLALLVSALWRRHARLPLVWPAQKAAAVAAFAGALGYALIAGFGVPAQRTLYMLGVVVLALVSGRAFGTARVLGAALVLVLLLDPWAVLSAGFWLSFGAVALLLHAGGGRRVARHWLTAWLRAQWAILLGLTPLLLALFQQFSLVSPFANAPAIPVVGLAVAPLALLGALPGCGWALELAHALLAPLIDFLAWLAAWPGALWQQHAPPWWAVPLALAGALWLLLPRGFPARWVGAILFLPLFLIPPERPAPGEFHLTVLDVGQGQAVHVRTATRDLLFDAGPDYGGAADAGGRVVVPYLRAVGARRLDMLIVSHADSDHAGGADSLLAAVPVARDERRCVAGDAWEWDGVRFRVLHPAAGDYARKVSTNALSCVLKIESPHGAALIPGDVEGRAERELLERHGASLSADILVAPHHGGKKTSSPEFVATVGAREVIFPVGYRNRFGHPHPDVVKRYAGASVLRTDRDGAVTLKVGAGGTAIVREREARRRYWNNRVPE